VMSSKTLRHLQEAVQHGYTLAESEGIVYFLVIFCFRPFHKEMNAICAFNTDITVVI
jgi:hypothetical protein